MSPHALCAWLATGPPTCCRNHAISRRGLHSFHAVCKTVLASPSTLCEVVLKRSARRTSPTRIDATAAASSTRGSDGHRRSACTK
eukprot:3607474-Rhodomonas_salina.1